MKIQFRNNEDLYEFKNKGMVIDCVVDEENNILTLGSTYDQTSPTLIHQVLEQLKIKTYSFGRQ